MGRDITVPELAIITDKSQGYVRQHVKRGHLRTRKEGRGVVVAFSDARQWAEEWRLPWNESTVVQDPPSMATVPGRIARVRVVAAEHDGVWANVVTTIRHRSGSQTGSWKVHSEPCPGLLVVGADLDMGEAQHFIDQALEGHVDVLHLRVTYKISDRRTHFSGHGEHAGLRSGSIRSPFATHAARVTEYWSVDDPPPELASKVGAEFPWIKLAGFDLGSWTDRIGNMLVFGALEDAVVNVTCEEGSVCLELKCAAPFRPGTYRATVIAWLADDCVLGRSVVFDNPVVRLAVVPDIDAFHVTLFGADGSILGEHENFLLREMAMNLVLAGPVVAIQQGKQEVYRMASRHRDSVMLIGTHSGAIHRRQIARRARSADAAARRQGLVRFSPGEAQGAIDHLASCIRALEGDARSVVYLGDPHFLQLDTSLDEHQRMFLKIVEACENRALRILSGVAPPRAVERWQALNPRIRPNVFLHSFTTNNATGVKAAFHDRFVACSTGELLITHSLNGWDSGGVTFCKLPSNVYLAEATALWTTRTKTTNVVEVFGG